MNKKLSDLDCEYKRRVFGRARFLLLWMVISLCTATGCAEEPHYILWQEEVSLSDGHTVIATQKVRCEGGNTGAQYAPCITRENWLTVVLPGYGLIEWHENLHPIVLNLSNRMLYLVAIPPTMREATQYGSADLTYVAFRWDNGAWSRIRIADVPTSLRTPNLLIDLLPPKGTNVLKLAEKDSPALNGNLGHPGFLRQLDPSRF